MYLKELTINGFKSFAKKSDLGFSVPITAIVGPNGSGKSNVAESFRFVLGEQSVKSMRGKKGEDLIWGGSEKVARGNRAAVELVFDNSEKKFALDFDEVKIERIVHRDGQNEYKLNGSQVRLKDVHELLAGANIGSTGHHIISQGEADRVLSAGPKERREMIEDALGLKVFQLKKHEADRKLNKTQENILQVESLRREAAPHLKYLKKQVERAERSLEVQEQLKFTYAEYLRREDTYIARVYDTLTERRRAPHKELETVVEKVKVAREKLSETEEKKVDSTELHASENVLRTIASERQAAQNNLSQLEGQITFLERRIAESNKPQAKAKKLIPYEQLEKLVEDISANAEKVLSNEDPKNLSRSLRDFIHQLRSFLKKSQGEVVDTVIIDTSELEALQSNITAAKRAVEELRTEEDKAYENVAAIRKSEVSGLEDQREMEKTLYELLQRQREIDSTLRQLDSELAVTERDREDFKRELQEAVSLLGRGASEYFSYTVVDSEGNAVTDEMIVNEPREKQRERRRELEKLKIRLEELGIGGTDDLLKEYKEAKERDEFLEKELADLAASVENLHELITELQGKLEEQFTVGVGKITTEFHKFFALMFGGGSASLERVKIKTKQGDEEEEEESEIHEGVDLQVSLPNKRVRGLDMLSGGERALTSIALIFAMSQVNPPPFIILDETDAALDEANSRRYGDMIEALAKKSQLVLITHNRETMSRAGVLYGITMGTDGISKVLSVKFDEAAVNAK